MPDQKSIAIVHDDFMQWGGAERLVSNLASLYPAAPIYTAVFDPKILSVAGIDPHRVNASFLNIIPFKKIWHKLLFFLYPILFEQFNFDEFEVVISSSARFAHGVITKPQTKHISYVNSPFRGFWEPGLYLGNNFVGKVLRFVLGPTLMRLRNWDYYAGQRADVVIGNSQIIQARIKKYWRRESKVIYPFVDFDRFNNSVKPSFSIPEKYFIVISRLVAWKRFDLVIKACGQLGASLIVVGDGPERERLQQMGNGDIHLVGFLSDGEVTYLLEHAEALIHPQKEDFGMTVVEANYCGTPVIAYQDGGALETVIEGITGEFFERQDVNCLTNVLQKFESARYDKKALKQQAKRFSKERFNDQIAKLVDEVA